MKNKAIEISALDESRLKILEEAIYNTANIDGDIFDCGVFRGGSSLYIKGCIDDLKINKKLYLFDTFEGIPEKSEIDIHNIGDIKGSSFDEVVNLFEGLDNVYFLKGIIPKTFKGLEYKKISVAHIDVDNYFSVKSCLDFIYPRVQKGGWIIIDDYNCSSCPGAKKAVDEFLINNKENLMFGIGQGNPQTYFIKQ